MNSHLMIISCLMVLLPSALFAATECRVVELPDRYEAICEGDEKIMAGSSYNDDQKSGHRIADQSARVTNTKLQPADVSLADSGRPKTKSAAVESLIAFRHNKLQRSDVEAKKAIRMQMIKSGRQNDPAPSHPAQVIEDN